MLEFKQEKEDGQTSTNGEWCYISNIQALCLPVSEKKNFEVFIPCSYVQTYDPLRRGKFWAKGHHMNKLGRGALGPQGHHKNKLGSLVESTIRCYIPNIKALCHPISEKKNFEDSLLCSYVLTCDPRDGAKCDPRGITWTNLVDVY